ncbi:MAG: WG repeat-containing protein [Cyclobacteriaceae bacterium]|nr:WG repeat-containing protein [Cyclobacteriaceae bacterium]
MRLNFFILSFIIFQNAIANNFQLFEENGKTGLKDQSGNVIIPARYEALGWSTGTFSVIQQTTGYKLNNRWGLINLNNRLVTPPEFVELEPTESELIIASKQNPATLVITRGCLNTAGKVIIPFVYSGIRVHGLRAITYTVQAQQQLRYGLTDLKHHTLLPAIYAHIYPLGNLRFAVQNTEGKTALFTENGQPLTGFIIDSVSSFHTDKAIIYVNGLQGLMNRNGEIVVPARYREIKWLNNTWLGRLPDSWYLLTAQHQVKNQTEADSMVVLPDGNLALISASRIWITDKNLKPLAGPIQADDLLPEPYSGGFIIRNGKRFGALRPDGTTILPVVFDSILAAGNVWIAKEKSQWFLYNSSGQRLSRAYDAIESLAENYFRIRKNGFEGLMNASAKELLPCVYDGILELRNGLVAVKFRNQYGIVTVGDTWVVPPQPHPIRLLDDETYLVQQGNLTWLKNLAGTALYFTNNPIKQQGEYLIEETSSGSRWTVSMEGRIVHRQLPAAQTTDWVGSSSEGFRPIRKNGRYGFINEDGLLMIPNRYEDVMPFREGRAGIKIRNKWGFIDRTDRIVVQPVYDFAQPFSNGISKVQQKGKWGLIDKDGKVLVPVQFDSLQILPSGRVLVKSESYYGLMDMDGDALLHTKYESITDLNNGLVIVKQDGKFGVVDVRGVALIPVNYDNLFYHAHSQQFIGSRKSKWRPIQ